MSSSSLKAKATELHSVVVRSRGVCEACGNLTQLECAHIVPRSYNAVRVDPANALCLCLSCHGRFTRNPPLFEAFVRGLIGSPAYDELWARARVITKGTDEFWQGWIDTLEVQHAAR